MDSLVNQSVIFTSVDFSGNSITTPEDFEVIFPFLYDIKKLDLSNNNIGRNSDGLRFLSHLLSNVTSLTHLDLSDNYIGVLNENNTLNIGHGISFLTQLRFLDLSNNQIGRWGSEGMIGLSESISALTQLVFLNISNNFIGYTDSRGTAALGESLPSLKQLQYLDLSVNAIEWTDSNGTIPFSNGLSNIMNLKYLNLYGNQIGLWDSRGTQSLGHSVSNLKSLQFLGMGYNSIGMIDSYGVLALGQGLRFLTQMTFLDLSQNFIGSEGLQPLVESLYNLKELTDFQFLPNPVTNADIGQINQALSHAAVPPLPHIIQSVDDAKTFCQSFSGSNCNLSGIFPSPTLPVVQVLFGCLGNKKEIRSLDLSNNLLGVGGASAVGEELWNLPNLTFLNLSWNDIGMGGDTNNITALFQGLSILLQLSSIDVSNNNMATLDWTTIAAFGQSISHLKNLTYLDFSINAMEEVTAEGSVIFCNSLSGLTQLTYLDLSGNAMGYINSNGVVALGDALFNLSQLTFLDLSVNLMGNIDSRGVIKIAQSLSTLKHLSFLDLSSNRIDYTDGLSSSELGKSLVDLTQLQYLDLSLNNIGFWGKDGEISLAKGISQMNILQFINLGGNNIGSTGPDGPQVLIPSLLRLPNLTLENLNVQGMANVSWSQAESYLQNLQSQAMMTACQTSTCFGGGIQPVSSLSQTLPSSVSQSRYLADVPFGGLLEMPSNTTLIAEGRALVPYNEPILSSDVDILSTLGSSALAGAVFAALPEAIGDTLHLSGLVSEQNAYRIKMASNAALVFATGSWMSTGASYLTTTGLQCLGVTESKARIGGNAAALLVNTGLSLTPTRLAAIALNYAAGRFGLWAEKGIIKKYFQPLGKGGDI